SGKRAHARRPDSHGKFFEAKLGPPGRVRMITLREALERLLEREHLSEAEAAATLRALTDSATPPAMAGALLAALRAKGVCADELRGFATTMRQLARRPVLPPGTPL